MVKRITTDRMRTLWAVYILLAIICCFITFTSRDTSFSTFFINLGMFAIIAWIFLFTSHKLRDVKRISDELKASKDQIIADVANNTGGGFLWGEYKNRGRYGLFPDGVLTAQYVKFGVDMTHYENSSNGGFKCDIGDYINKEYIDNVSAKNILTTVPGVLTGLGILGTFLGLSIGLQNFSTGTSAEIMESIAPLMNGIKVAFHTSIYGMVFSLLYNWVLNGILEDSYNALDDFLDCFDKYVVGDPESFNRVIEQNTFIRLQAGMDEIQPEKFVSAFTPFFEKQNEQFVIFSDAFKAIEARLETLEGLFGNLAEHISKQQVESISALTGQFIEALNQATGESFKQLSEAIRQTCEFQEQSAKYMGDILERIGMMSDNLKNMNEMSEKTIEGMAGYISEIESLQKIINENFMSVNIQLEAHKEAEDVARKCVEEVSGCQKELNEAIGKFTQQIGEAVVNYTKQISSESSALIKQIEAVYTTSGSISGEMQRSSQELSKAAQGLNNQLQTALNTTFDTFDRNLADITKHLSGTILQIENTTARVPKVVDASYDGMEKSFKDMQANLEALIHALDILQKNLPRFRDIVDED